MRHLRLFLRRTYGGLPAVTWICCAAAFVNRAGAMVLPFLGLYLRHRFDYTIEQALDVVSLFGIGSILGSIGGGKLADRFGPVRLQLASLLTTAAWMGLLALAQTPWTIAIGMLLLGVFNDAFRPGNVATVAASCAPYRQAKALALNRLALNAGWAIGPAVGGMLASQDYRLLFAADGLTCALAGLVLWRWVPRSLGAAPGRHLQTMPATTLARRQSPWTDGPFLLLLGLAVLCFMTFLQHFQTLSQHLKGVLRLDEGTIGMLLIINPLLIVLLEMPLVHAMRGRAMLPLVVAGALCTGLAYPWLVAESWGMAAVIASILMLTLGEMLYMPFLGAYVSERAPPQARGSYLGAYFATFSLGFVLAPAIGGRIYDRFGPDVLWYSCLGTGALVAVGFHLLHRFDRRSRR